jgi:3-phosphoglycerate kinase
MRTLRELGDLKGKRVLVRVDFNVPFDDAGNVTDDTRIRGTLPTLRELLAQGARLILVSHLGRPKGHDPKLSTAPVAKRLSELLQTPVKLAPAVIGDEVTKLAGALKDGEILMLENVRFEAGETKNDDALSASLAALADVYVNDAFGASHRAHSSTVGAARLLPHAAGLLLEREVETLTEVTQTPKRPMVAILGGSKVSDKIKVIERFLNRARGCQLTLRGRGCRAREEPAERGGRGQGQAQTAGRSRRSRPLLCRGYAGRGGRCRRAGRHDGSGHRPQDGRRLRRLYCRCRHNLLERTDGGI